MVDDFLKDLDLNEYPSLSYNWSLTNTAQISDCSFNDPPNVMGQLNAFCRSYVDNSINPMGFVQPILIDARSGSGDIIVPDDGELLVCGLSNEASGQVALVLELAINGGTTIISAISYGIDNPEMDSYLGNQMKREVGRYVVDTVNEISYSEREILAPGKYRIKISKDEDIPMVGSLLKFPIPGSFNDYYSYYIQSADGSGEARPLPFKVLEASQNAITIERYTKEQIIEDKAFSESYSESDTITVLDLNEIPDANEDIYMSSHFENLSNGIPVRHYLLVCRDTGLPFYKEAGKITQTTDIQSDEPNSILIDIRNRYIASGYNAAKYNQDLLAEPSAPAYNYPIMTQRYPILSFKSFDLNPRSGSVHAGDRIPCKDWSLRIYMVGDASAVNQIRFTREKDDNSKVCAFMAKAKWGFIPAVDKDDLPRQTVNVRSPLWKRWADSRSATSSSITHSSSSMG
jgi:hypothetical protein